MSRRLAPKTEALISPRTCYPFSTSTSRAERVKSSLAAEVGAAEYMVPHEIDKGVRLHSPAAPGQEGDARNARTQKIASGNRISGNLVGVELDSGLRNGQGEACLFGNEFRSTFARV